MAVVDWYSLDVKQKEKEQIDWVCVFHENEILLSIHADIQMEPRDPRQE